MIFVLTHEYSDKSAFRVCGVTENPHVATAWREASRAQSNEECKVYQFVAYDNITFDGQRPWGYTEINDSSGAR